MSDFRTEASGTAHAVLWLVDGREIEDRLLECGKRRLGSSEQQRYVQFLRLERRRQFLLGRMLLRLAIGQSAGIPPSSIQIMEQPGFSPQLDLPDSVRRPGFSLSHSGHWIACVVSVDTEIGLDVEMSDPQRDVIALSAAAFDANEQMFVQRHRGDERLAAFYRIWTMKEALFKLESNLSAPRMMSTVVDPHGELLIDRPNRFFSHLEHPDLSMSLCSSSPLEDIHQRDATEVVRQFMAEA